MLLNFLIEVDRVVYLMLITVLGFQVISAVSLRPSHLQVNADILFQRKGDQLQEVFILEHVNFVQFIYFKPVLLTFYTFFQVLKKALQQSLVFSNSF